MSSSLRDASFIISVCHTRPKTFKRIAGPSRHVFRRLPRIVPDIVSSIGRCSMKTPFLGKGQTYRRISTRPSEIATNLRSTIISRACVFTADKTGKWCPREDSNLRPQDSYHFGFNRRPVANGQDVRGLDCPFTMGLAAFRCCPSSLYTFTGFLRSLARDWHAGRPAKLSPTLSRSIASFPGATPNLS